MDYEQLYTFEHIAQCNSFSNTAAELHLTQPSITLRMARLESELGCKLFHRKGGQSAQLTEAGKVFRPYVQKILALHKESQEALDTHNEKSTNNYLKIGTTPSLGNTIVGNLVHSFHNIHPRIQVIVNFADYTPQILQMLNTGQIDIGIVRNAIQNLPNFNAHILENAFVEDKIVAVSSPLISLEDKPEFSPADLSGLQVIAYKKNSLLWGIVCNYYKKFAVEPQTIIEVDNFELAKSLVMLGLGVAFLPEPTVQEEILNKKLKLLPLQEADNLKRGTSIVRLDNKPVKPAVRYFIKVLEAQLGVALMDTAAGR